MDWRLAIASVISSKSAIFELDRGLIFRYGLPHLPATVDEIQAAETRLGRELESNLRAFLQFANGIPAVTGNDELFGTSDLGQGGKWQGFAEYAQMLGVETPGFPSNAIPIGGSLEDASLVTLGAGSRPAVVTWFYAGQRADQWANLYDYLWAAVRLNEINLRDIGGDTALRRAVNDVRLLSGLPPLPVTRST